MRLPIVIVLTGWLVAQSAQDAVRLFEMETGFGSRAQSLGNAYTAVANDISGLYWNPAGLGKIQESSLSMQFDHGRLGNTSTYLGNPTLASHQWTKINGLGYVHAVDVAQGSLVWGISYNKTGNSERTTEFSGFSTVPNNLVFEDGDGNEFLFDRDATRFESIRLTGGIDQWSTGFSIAISPTTLVGASVSLNSGKDAYHFLFKQTDTEDNYNTFPLDYHRYDVERYLETEFTGIQWKFGGLISLGKLNMGAMISPSFTYRVKEMFTDEETMFYDDDTYEVYLESDPGQWSYDVTSPFQFSGGLSITGNQHTFAFSARYMDWSQIQFDLSGDAIYDGDYLDLLSENSTIRSNYNPTLDIHIGSELFLIRDILALQAGYTIKEGKTDSEKGMGILSGGLRFFPDSMVDVQLSLLNKKWNQSSSDGFTPSTVQEQFNLNQVQVGLNYRF